MKLTQILSPQCIETALTSSDKTDAIVTLVNLLAESGSLTDREEVLRAVLEREAIRSTGVGDGLAIPHGKSKGCDKLVMALGRTVKPIDFESIDGKPVELIVLLAAPVDQTGPHIQALARISRLMLREDFRGQVMSASTGEEVYGVIAKFEEKLERERD